jgi:hypothetical protein
METIASFNATRPSFVRHRHITQSHLGDRLRLTIYLFTQKMAKRKQATTQSVVERKKNKSRMQVSIIIK